MSYSPTPMSQAEAQVNILMRNKKWHSKSKQNTCYIELLVAATYTEVKALDNPMYITESIFDKHLFLTYSPEASSSDEDEARVRQTTEGE